VTNSVERADALIVGAGLSGIATALGVALRGGTAIVFESSDLIGGAAAYSGGMIWCAANHVMEREGLSDSLELGEAYVRGISAAHPELIDDAALDRWLQQSPIAMKYWEDQGAIRWEIIPELATTTAMLPARYHLDAT